MDFVYYLVMSLLVFVAVLLIMLILIQKGRGGGISSAFGGGGGSSAFGAKTGDVLTWATSIIFGVFLLLGVTLDLIVQHQFGSTPPVVASHVQEPVTSTPVNQAPTAPTTPPVSTTPPTTLPTITVPTTQSITNTGNQLIQTGKDKATGLINSTTQQVGQQAAPLLNHK